MAAVTAIAAVLLMIALTIAGGWGLFHARRVLVHRTTALRDAFWMTLAFFFVFRSTLELILTSQLTWANQLIGSVMAPLTSGALCILVFPSLFWLNLHLVALAGIVSRKDDAAERSMLPLFWPVFAVSFGLDFLLYKQRFWPPGFACLMAPAVTLYLIRLLRRRDLETETFFYQITARLHRKCTFRRGKRTLDLRGVVLGTIAGTLVLLTTAPLLGPYQRSAYVNAIQLGSSLHAMLNLLNRGDEPDLPSLFQITGATNRRDPFSDLVVVRYDITTRHRTTEPDRAEAQVEATLVEKLALAKPKAIVLPLPPEQGQEIPQPPSLTEDRLTEQVATLNPKFYTTLAKVIKAAGCVYLYATPYRSPHKALKESARASGTAQITGFGPASIPAMTIPRGNAPAQAIPLLLSPQTKPLPAFVLIDYRVDLHEQRAPILTSQILRDEPLFDASSQKWVSAKTFFAGKTIFVEAASPRYYSTPVGLRSEAEVLAQITATLRMDESLQLLPLWIEVVIVLCLAALVGHLSVGRAPLEALWRTTLPILLVVSGVFGATAFGDYAADPIRPLVGALLAFFIVTQFTFTIERSERDRNRSVLRRFLPPQIIDQMVDDPETKLGLGGKRRPIVVLFVDVRGFSGFAERRTPEEVVTTMNHYLAAMTDALNDHEGILDKYTGDGLMALFPVDDESVDVLRAVNAAIAMAQAVQRVARHLQAEGGDELAVGIGLHYGDAVVGLVGHPTRQVNYTALGHTVVVAARLQSLAAGGEIILSETVFKALPVGMVSAEVGESVSVKGVAKPIPVYRLKVGNPPNR